MGPPDPPRATRRRRADRDRSRHRDHSHRRPDARSAGKGIAGAEVSTGGTGKAGGAASPGGHEVVRAIVCQAVATARSLACVDVAHATHVRRTSPNGRANMLRRQRLPSPTLLRVPPWSSAPSGPGRPCFVADRWRDRGDGEHAPAIPRSRNLATVGHHGGQREGRGVAGNRSCMIVNTIREGSRLQFVKAVGSGAKKSNAHPARDERDRHATRTRPKVASRRSKCMRERVPADL